MKTLWLDYETFSETPIGWGTHRYTTSCEAMLATYAIDDGPVQVWDVTEGGPMPLELKNGMHNAGEIIAHNSQFDRLVTKWALGIEIPIERWRCSMVRALAHALPGSLDKLCTILKIDDDLAKHKEGKALVLFFCKPRAFCHEIDKLGMTGKEFKAHVAVARENWTGRATRHTHPLKWARFIAYAKADISSMRAVWHKLPSWNYKGLELSHWHLDQKINDRGFAVDLDLAEAALRAVDMEQACLRDQVFVATDGDVASATKRDQLLQHILEAHGVMLPDMQKSTLERRLEDPDLPAAVRELIAIRLQASATSTSKYKALINATTEGRCRGTIQFDGASRTLRAAGRTFQPQNLPSRGLLPSEEIAVGIELMKMDAASLVFPNVMKLTSSAIRGCVVAPPGKKLVISDLSNIEGRMLAWLAGEEWKLQAFRDFDNGIGPDLYKLAYAKSFGIDASQVTKDQRQIGKVLELFLGFAGGVGAFLSGAITYGFDIEEMAANAYPLLPEEVVDECSSFYEWALKKEIPMFGLSKQAYIVCDAFKRLWRYAHPATVAMWAGVEDACKRAVETPGTTIETGRFKMRRDGAWLRVLLPAGRYLCYPSPEIDNNGGLSYMGNNQYTRKWERLKTFSGKLVENATQGCARHILYDAMPEIENAGYSIILHVHDEILSEVPDTDSFNETELSRLLSINPPWAEGLPLAAAGFSGYRYKKE